MEKKNEQAQDFKQSQLNVESNPVEKASILASQVVVDVSRRFEDGGKENAKRI